MVLIEYASVSGWVAALRGMRQPYESHSRADTAWNTVTGLPIIGKNDMELAKKLCRAGSEHRKFLRMIIVSCDITAPMMWNHQLDTYKVGTVRNSTSKMHKLGAKAFEIEDFSLDGITDEAIGDITADIDTLNGYRAAWLKARECKDRVKEKRYWETMLRMLPESYNQKFTWQANYEVLSAIYRQRKGHKLSEWRDFLEWIRSLPYSELITGEFDEDRAANV